MFRVGLARLDTCAARNEEDGDDFTLRLYANKNKIWSFPDVCINSANQGASRKFSGKKKPKLGSGVKLRTAFIMSA